MGPSVARSGHFRAAVENVLDREVNVFALPTTGNLDPVSQTAQGTVRPTRTTILRNVLIQRVRQIGLALHIAPRKVVGQGPSIHVRVRKRTRVIIQDSMTIQILYTQRERSQQYCHQQRHRQQQQQRQQQPSSFQRKFCVAITQLQPTPQEPTINALQCTKPTDLDFVQSIRIHNPQNGKNEATSS